MLLLLFYLCMKLEMDMKIPNPSVFTIALSTCHYHLGGPYPQRFPHGIHHDLSTLLPGCATKASPLGGEANWQGGGGPKIVL